MYKYLNILSSLVFFSFIPSAAVAQIIPDSSLGTENSVVESNGNRDTINGGAVRNTNLFHSFQEFNVDVGRETYFTNPDGIANIFSRVTGNNLSNIQGVLGVLGNANLFLINPNGILFGENARLDVNGSFFATTADSVLFDNGFEFSAVDANQPPLLTIDIPIGLRFRDNPGDITVRGKSNGIMPLDIEAVNNQAALRINSDSTIGLIGGNLLFEDATIESLGGRIEIGGIQEGKVNLVEVADGFTLNYSEVETFGDISLSGISFIDASGLGGGDIQVAGKNISITGLSGLGSVTLGAKPGGDINILATESLEISGVANKNNLSSTIANQVFSTATADGGDINIETRRLYLGNLAVIGTTVFGQSNAGDIKINARESIFLDGQGSFSNIGSNVADGGAGNAGNITLNTDSLNLTNGASITSRTFGAGNAGNITLNTNSLNLANEAIITGSTFGGGNAGSITLNTVSLNLANGASIISSTLGAGNAGNITINATDHVFLSRGNSNNSKSLISSSIGSEAVGSGGKIRIETKNLFLANGSQIISTTRGKGNAGIIDITATESISLDGEGENGVGSVISSSVRTGAIGKGGEIRINTQNLSLTNGTQIESSTFGKGNAGNVTIDATESIFLDGENSNGFNSAIASPVQPGAIGNGGEVRINTKSLSLNDGAFLSSSNFGEGNAGIIDINATESISLIGKGSQKVGSSITNLGGSPLGNGGEIKIDTKHLSLTDTAFISSSTRSKGKTGNIGIEANSLLLENQGSITAITTQGEQGNITLLIADRLILKNNSQISARATNEAKGGNIDIDAKFIIAFPNQNNDIIASAEQGQGGKITLTTEALFGIKERPLDPITNDINASSESGLSGIVNITQPDVNPASGLVDLTQEVIDPAKLIAQNVCTQTANSKFVDIGKGGLPQNPQDILAEDTVDVGLVAPVAISEAEEQRSRGSRGSKGETRRLTRKPPAQGWIWHENGIVELVAYNPHRTGDRRTWDNHNSCL